MIDESIQEVFGKQLEDAEHEIIKEWGKEVDQKLDNLLEFRIINSEGGVSSTQRQRVIIYYKPKKDFESLVEDFEDAVSKQRKSHEKKGFSADGDEETTFELTEAEFEEEFRFIEDNFNEDVRHLLKALEEDHIEVEEHLRLGNAVIAELTPKQIKEISMRPDVLRVEGERSMKLELDQSAVTVGVVQARSDGVVGTGKGVIVAVLDGEVDVNHPDLKGRVVHKKNYTQESWGNPSKHGTHVAGIVAGNGSVYKGMAPEAIIWNYKIYPSQETESKEGSRSADAIEDAVKDGAQVINCSWGVPQTDLDGKSVWAVTAERATKLGVVLVKSAGNSGPDEGTLTSPADAQGDVIVVGAANREGSGITDFSSRGPTADNRSKPDIVAPGEKIMSAKEGGDYRQLSGTSMAAPHISGIVALLLERNPRLKPWQVKKILTDSAKSLGTEFDRNTQGVGLVDVVNATKIAGNPIKEANALTLNISRRQQLREQLTILLKNTGIANISHVQGALQSRPEVKVLQANGDFGSLRVGGEGVAAFDIEVSPDAKPGTYELILNVSFKTAAGEDKIVPYTISYEIFKKS